VEKQVRSTNLVLTPDTRRIYVDGGFTKNEKFLVLLAQSYPGLEVYAAEVAQASALGAALAIHEAWNTKERPKNLVKCSEF
jgi:L-fuculokinase